MLDAKTASVDMKSFVEDGYRASLFGALGAVLIGLTSISWLSGVLPNSVGYDLLLIFGYYSVVIVGVAAALFLGKHELWISTALGAGALYFLSVFMPFAIGRLLFLPALLVLRWLLVKNRHS